MGEKKEKRGEKRGEGWKEEGYKCKRKGYKYKKEAKEDQIQIQENRILSYTIFTFPLFFDLILCYFILISFRLYDASAFIMFSLSCYLQPPSLCHSVLHPLSIICPPSP